MKSTRWHQNVINLTNQKYSHNRVILDNNGAHTISAGNYYQSLLKLGPLPTIAII